MAVKLSPLAASVEARERATSANDEGRHSVPSQMQPSSPAFETVPSSSRTATELASRRHPRRPRRQVKMTCSAGRSFAGAPLYTSR